MTADGPGGADEVFGPYVLRSLLGRGGMGEVWHAHHTVLDREVALKRISGGPSRDPELRARFRREARLAARLSSAHVVPIHDFGEIDDQLFLDMRLVPGPDLRTVLDGSPEGLDPMLAGDIVVQLADALDAAHEQELVHRDVKPSNVLVDTSRGPGRWFCYLADFGVAVPVAADTRITRTGMTVGTPTYMAPELLAGDGRAGVASDVYALGCLLYELLTGRPPFAGATDAAVLYQHAYAEPPLPSARRPWLVGYDAAVHRALAKDPARRFETAGELAGALPTSRPSPPPVGTPPPFPPQPSGPPSGPPFEVPSGRWSGQPPGMPPAGSYGRPPVPPGSTPVPPGRRRRPWLPAALVAVVLLLAGAGVGGYLWSTRADAPGPTAAPLPPAAVVVRELRGFSFTYGVASSPDGRTVWAVADDGSGPALYGMDVGSGDVLSRIPLGPRVNKVVLSPDGSRAYLTAPGTDDYQGSNVEIVDLTNLRVVTDVTVGPRPLFAVLSPDATRLYVGVRGVTDDQPGAIAVVDTTHNTLVGTVPVGVHPSGIAVSPDGRTLYVANRGTTAAPGDTVSVVDTAGLRVVRSVLTRPTPYGVALTRDGRTLYVATNAGTDNGTLDVIDTGTFAVSARPAPSTRRTAAVALTPDGRRLLITNLGYTGAPGSTVTVLDVTGGPAPPPAQIGDDPRDIAVSPDGTHAFVVTEGPGGRVYVLDLP